MREPIAVVGGGSIGLLLAAHLARAGNRVTVVCRTAEQARALAAYGIELDPGDGSPVIGAPVHATTARALTDPVPWAILAVKTPDVARVLGAWPKGLGTKGVVAVENGLLAAEEVLRAFGPGRALVGATRLGASRLSGTKVLQAGRGPTLLGALDGAGAAKVPVVAGWWREAGLLVEETDGRRAIWWKTALNAAINPVAAVLGIRNGELLERTEWHWILQAVVKEASEVAVREGVALEPGALFHDVLDTLRETARNRCSMLVDLEARHETELFAITGQILAAADRQGTSVEANRALYHLVRARIEALGP